MPLTGHVSDLSLPNLIQLHCTEGRTARLALTANTLRGTIYLAGGEIVDAQARGLSGEEAVYEMLRWQDAEFQVELDTPAWNQHTIHAPWNSIVLEGLRLLDEAQAARLDEMEQALRALAKQRGVRAATLIAPDGTLRATSSDTVNPAEIQALVKLEQTAHAIGTLLERGKCEHILINFGAEKILVVKQGDDYLGCWLEARTATEPIKNLLRSLGNS